MIYKRHLPWFLSLLIAPVSSQTLGASQRCRPPSTDALLPLSPEELQSRWDCSGLIEHAHSDIGLPLRGSVASLYESARSAGLLHHRARPLRGDVAFFHDTHDRNKNGHRDDRFTHIALVESVNSAGTITLVHLGSRGIRRIQMNLRHPGARRNAEGIVLNDYIRRVDDGGPMLTGELWAGFASFWLEGCG